MEFITHPNLPEKQVKLVVIDGRINCEDETTLLKKGISLIRTRRFNSVYEAISYHPDIILHHIIDNKIVVAPGIDTEFVMELKSYGFELIEGSTSLTSKYPGNIAYNVARVGAMAFHNLKYTDVTLKNELEKISIELKHVNQGYAKCSVAVINNRCIITSDNGIAKVASRSGIEVFLLDPIEGILLPGLSNGFFGGSVGLIDKDRLLISGNIKKLKSADKIINFLKKQNIKVEILSDNQVIDLGSIIPLGTVK